MKASFVLGRRMVREEEPDAAGLALAHAHTIKTRLRQQIDGCLQVNSLTHRELNIDEAFVLEAYTARMSNRCFHRPVDVLKPVHAVYYLPVIIERMGLCRKSPIPKLLLRQKRFLSQKKPEY